MEIIVDFIYEWSKGNPGAAQFLLGLIKPNNLPIEQVAVISNKLENLTAIRGTNLYILFNDLCQKDYNKVYELCKNCPDEILVDACSRLDRSGKKLIENYLGEK